MKISNCCKGLILHKSGFKYCDKCRLICKEIESLTCPCCHMVIKNFESELKNIINEMKSGLICTNDSEKIIINLHNKYKEF